MKVVTRLFIAFVLFFLFTGVSFAHVVVKPAEVSVGSFQTFTMGVPNEQDSPVTQIRLVIPNGLKHVTPNVKPGWTVTTTRKGDVKGGTLNTGETIPEEEQDDIVEITWSGGSVPPGLRDDFSFSAQVSEKPTSLNWNAYQTYENGTTVAWDKNGSHDTEFDFSKEGPYSTTDIIDDLSEVTPQTAERKIAGFGPFEISLVALGISLISFVIILRKK